MEIITICNHGYRDYTWNLALHCQRAGIPLTIYTTDNNAAVFLRNQGISSRRFQPKGKTSTLMSQINSEGFSSMCKAKLELICERIRESTAEYLVYMDGDIAALKNFTEDIKFYLQQADLAFQCDEKDPTACGEEGCPNACTGFFAMRLRDRAALLRIFDPNANQARWRAVRGLDQDFVNLSLKETDLLWTTLPRDLYPNGVYLSRKLYDKQAAFILHFNYLVGSQKRVRMIQEGKWILPIHFGA